MYEYDALGLKVSAASLALEKDGEPYRLRREVTYDPAFYEPVTVSRWMLDGAPQASERGDTLIAYDSFGRRSAIAEPGDSLAAPTLSFEYVLADPVSRIVTRARSQTGEALDLEKIECLDRG